ncbi:MAG: histidine kinase [Clostridia bacterium]|nr:histidine kinase [Clostridia bacterium]
MADKNEGLNSGADGFGKEERIRQLEEQIADLRARLPAHSVKPAMLVELEELEEELERLRNQ